MRQGKGVYVTGGGGCSLFLLGQLKMRTGETGKMSNLMLNFK